MSEANETKHERAYSAEQVELLKQQFKKKSQLAAIWQRFKKNKMAVAGLIIFGIMVLAALTAPLYIDYEKDVVEQTMSKRFQPISAEHWFGTDHFGRDIFSRIVWGSRISMFVGLAAIAISTVFGIIIGSAAGFYGGVIDNVLMRLMDILLAIPGTLLSISIVAALGNSVPNLLLALGVSLVPKMSRLVRSSVLTLKNQEFVEAAYACGTSEVRIIFRHIMPNALGTIIVDSALTIARTIISIAGLSFIGLGIQPPAPEWGAMLSEAKAQMLNYPYLVYAPGLAIVITVACLTMVGDGLRDALDPKMKK